MLPPAGQPASQQRGSPQTARSSGSRPRFGLRVKPSLLPKQPALVVPLRPPPPLCGGGRIEELRLAVSQKEPERGATLGARPAPPKGGTARSRPPHPPTQRRVRRRLLKKTLKITSFSRPLPTDVTDPPPTRDLERGLIRDNLLFLAHRMPYRERRAIKNKMKFAAANCISTRSEATTRCVQTPSPAKTTNHNHGPLVPGDRQDQSKPPV